MVSEQQNAYDNEVNRLRRQRLQREQREAEKKARMGHAPGCLFAFTPNANVCPCQKEVRDV